MKQLTLIIASCLGGLSVILGAFGAHALKKILPAEKIASFETGVKYQMYHAIVLLILGIYFNFEQKTDSLIVWFMTAGILIFSGSIYLLSSFDNLKFLGPITPLGGALLIAGWVMLVYRFVVSV